MWHVTRDMWHVTYHMWHVSCCGRWTFSQNFSSLAPTICDLGYYEDLEERDDWLTDSLNDEAVSRTAPATPGLSKSIFQTKQISLKQGIPLSTVTIDFPLQNANLLATGSAGTKAKHHHEGGNCGGRRGTHSHGRIFSDLKQNFTFAFRPKRW